MPRRYCKVLRGDDVVYRDNGTPKWVPWRPNDENTTLEQRLNEPDFDPFREIYPGEPFYMGEHTKHDPQIWFIFIKRHRARDWRSIERIVLFMPDRWIDKGWYRVDIRCHDYHFHRRDKTFINALNCARIYVNVLDDSLFDFMNGQEATCDVIGLPTPNIVDTDHPRLPLNFEVTATLINTDVKWGKKIHE